MNGANLARLLVKNSVLSLVNTFLIGSLNLLSSVVAARHLAPQDMGSYSFTVFLVNTLGFLASMGIPTSLLRFATESRSVEGENAAMWLLRRAVSATLLFALIWVLLLMIVSELRILGSSFALSPRQRMLVAVGVLSFAMRSTLVGYAQSQFHYKRLVWINASSLIALLLSYALFGLLMPAVDTFVALYVSMLFFSCIALLVLYRSLFLSRYSLQTSSLLRRASGYSLSVATIGLVDLIVWQRSEVIFLQLFNHQADIAFYSMAYDFSSTPLKLASAALSPVLLSSFTHLYTLERVRLSQVFEEATKYLALFSFFFAAFVYALIEPTVLLLFGKSYLPVVHIVRILIVSASLSSAATAGSALLYAAERQNFILRVGLLLAVLNTSLALLMVPPFGAAGAALSNSIAQVVGLAAGATYFVKEFGLSYPWISLLRIAAGAWVTAAAMTVLLSLDSSIFGLVTSLLTGLGISALWVAMLRMRFSEFSGWKVLLSDMLSKIFLKLR